MGRADDDLLDILQAADPPDPSDQHLLGAPVGVAASHVQVAVLKRLLDLFQRDVVLMHAVKVDQHLHLLASAPHRDDLRDAGDREQPAADLPVGQRADFQRGRLAGFAPHPDELNLSQQGRHGTELGAHVRRQAGSR